MADYTLQQLADLAGVTPRTVRYYIAQGLLPSPGVRAGARYSDTHLERLRLIRRLQRSHLPLAEIRGQLNRGSAADYIESLLRPPARPAAPMAAPAFRTIAAGPRRDAPPPMPDRSQWDRVALAPDIELHVRRPLTRDQNRRVDRLIAVARELLDEDRER